jgi:hypothetical protein
MSSARCAAPLTFFDSFLTLLFRPPPRFGSFGRLSPCERDLPGSAFCTLSITPPLSFRDRSASAPANPATAAPPASRGVFARFATDATLCAALCAAEPTELAPFAAVCLTACTPFELDCRDRRELPELFGRDLVAVEREPPELERELPERELPELVLRLPPELVLRLLEPFLDGVRERLVDRPFPDAVFERLDELPFLDAVLDRLEELLLLVLVLACAISLLRCGFRSSFLRLTRERRGETVCIGATKGG